MSNKPTRRRNAQKGNQRSNRGVEPEAIKAVVKTPEPAKNTKKKRKAKKK